MCFECHLTHSVPAQNTLPIPPHLDTIPKYLTIQMLYTISSLACSPFITCITTFQNIFSFPLKSFPKSLLPLPVRHSFCNFNCLFHNCSRSLPGTLLSYVSQSLLCISIQLHRDTGAFPKGSSLFGHLYTNFFTPPFTPRSSLPTHMSHTYNHIHHPYPSPISINHIHQPYPSTISINHIHQPYPSTISINPIHQPYPSPISINHIYQPYRSTISINYIHQPYPSTISINHIHQSYSSTISITHIHQLYPSTVSINHI